MDLKKKLEDAGFQVLSGDQVEALMNTPEAIAGRAENQRIIDEQAKKPLPAFKLKNPEDWAKGLANNTDPYGAAIYRYAAHWAARMELGLATGATVAECAKAASHEADIEGITGFMYGAAVAVLSHCWAYGDALRSWHNKSYGASESDGVVNPAIITIKD